MLTQEFLREHFHYNPDTGIFTCLKPISKKRRIGDVMGSLGKGYNRGYVIIGIKNNTYRAHKLAWLYMYGFWPKELDHINHDRQDNRISNLRIVSHGENMKNMKKRRNNTSGFTGITWDKQTSKWRAEITVNNKSIKLGRFVDLKGAVEARKQAEIKYKFHLNHGN